MAKNLVEKGWPLTVLAHRRREAIEDLKARGAAEAAGRDPASVEITASMPDDPAELPALAARGISRVLIPVTSGFGLRRRADGLEGVLSWKDTIERHAAL